MGPAERGYHWRPDGRLAPLPWGTRPVAARVASTQELGVLGRRRRVGVRPGVDRCTMRVDAQPGRAPGAGAPSACSTRSTGRPRRPRPARRAPRCARGRRRHRRRTRRRSGTGPEVGAERASRPADHRAAAPGPCRRARDRPRRRPARSPNPPWQSDIAASNSASKVSDRASHRSKVAPAGASVAGQLDEPLADVDAVTGMPRRASSWA